FITSLDKKQQTSFQASYPFLCDRKSIGRVSYRSPQAYSKTNFSVSINLLPTHFGCLAGARLPSLQKRNQKVETFAASAQQPTPMHSFLTKDISPYELPSMPPFF